MTTPRLSLRYMLYVLLALILVNPYTLSINRASYAYLLEVRAAMAKESAIPFFSISDHPRAQYWNALAALRNGDDQNAIHLAKPLSAYGDKLAMQILAQAYEQSGDYNQAIPLWQQVGDFNALLKLAEYASQNGDLDMAYQAYAAAQQLNPKEATIPMAHFLLEQMQDSQAAQSLLEEALQQNPLSSARPYWLLMLAELQAADENWAGAVESYRLAIESAYLMVPGERKLSRYYTDMAWALFQSGQIDQAVQAIDQALALEDFELPLTYLLRAAQIYEAAGQIEKAITLYQRVLELKPEEKSAQDALKRLKPGP